MTDVAKHDTHDDDVAMDDTNLRYRPRVPQQMYNLFVPNENFKRSILINPINQGMQEYTLESGSADQESYRFTCVLTPSVAYSNIVEFSVKRLVLTVSNIKFSRDLMRGQYDGRFWSVAKTPDAHGCVQSRAGCPCVLIDGVSALACDPLNAIVDTCVVAIGNNGASSTKKLNEAYIDFASRFYDASDLKRYNCTLLPDRYSKYNATTFTCPAPQEYSVMLDASDSVVGIVPAYIPRKCTLEYASQDPDNILSGVNRGQANYTCVFQKAIASPNYTWNATSGVWVATANTTTLNNVNWNGLQVPCSCSQGDMNFVLTEQFGPAFFYYNNKNASLFGVTIGVDEPAGQSLTQIVTFTDLVTTVRNDVLANWGYGNSFVHNNNLTITLNMATDKTRILKTAVQASAGEALGFIKRSDGSIGVQWLPVFQNQNGVAGDNVQVSVSIHEPKILLKSFTLPLGLPVAKTCTIPYDKFETDVFDVKTQLPQQGQPLNQQGVFTISNFQPMPFTKVPKMLVLFLSESDSVTGTLHQKINYSPCARSRIHKLSLSFDGGPDIMGKISESELYRMGRRNGLKNYNWNSIIGEKCPSAPIQILTWVGGVGYISQTIPALAQAQDGLKILSSGTILVLRFGGDIPLPEGLNANVSNVNSTMSFQLQCSSLNDDADYSLKLHVYRIYDDELVINSEMNCLASNPTNLTKNDAVNAISMFANKVKSGKCYANSDSMKAGSIFSASLHHIRGMLAKILPAVHKGVQFYDDHRETIHKGLTHGANLVDKFGDTRGNATHKSISDMLHMLKQRTA